MLQKLKLKLLDNRGQVSFNSLPVIITLLVVGFITLGLGANVLSDIQSTQAAGSVAANASGAGLSAFQNMSNLLPVVGVVIAAALILGALAFFGRGR